MIRTIMFIKTYFDWSVFDQVIIIDNQAFITKSTNSYADWIFIDFELTKH